MSYAKKVMKGVYVPLITPFNEDESIDFDGYKKVIDYVIEGGVDGVLLAGSTGEFWHMTLEEQKEVIKKGCEFVDGRVDVVAGTWMHTPKETIELTNYAADCGADFGLVLPPFYHSNTEDGIYDFFKEVAEGSKIGIVVYHTPGNTAVELSPSFIRRLSQIDGIAAVKETIDFTHTSNTYMATYDIPNFAVVEANEPKLIASYAVGVPAAFSIAFNAIPKEARKLYDLVWKENDIAAARELNKKLYPLYELQEEEPYPGPIKAVMNAIGLPAGRVRKPLPQPSKEMCERARKVMKDLGYEVK